MNPADEMRRNLGKSYGTLSEQVDVHEEVYKENDRQSNIQINDNRGARAEAQPLVAIPPANSEKEYSELRPLKTVIGGASALGAVGLSAASVSALIRRYYNGAFPLGCARAITDVKNNCFFNSSLPFFIYVKPEIDWQMPNMLYVPGAAICLGLALFAQVALGRNHPLAKFISLLAATALSGGLFTYSVLHAGDEAKSDGDYWGYINCWSEACHSVCGGNGNCLYDNSSFPGTLPSNPASFFTQWPVFAVTCGLLLISYITSLLSYKRNENNNELPKADNIRHALP